MKRISAQVSVATTSADRSGAKTLSRSRPTDALSRANVRPTTQTRVRAGPCNEAKKVSSHFDAVFSARFLSVLTKRRTTYEPNTVARTITKSSTPRKTATADIPKPVSGASIHVIKKFMSSSNMSGFQNIY